jgi:O-antigen/teichoic acid export membrane protein
MNGAGSETAADLLRKPEAGGRVVRGGLVRGIGYVVSTMVGLALATLLLRYLGVRQFGKYATVMAILGIVSGVTDAGLTTVAGRELAVVRDPEERRRLLSNLLALRIVAAFVGAIVAVLFVLVAGYGRELVIGTAIGGVGVILTSAQSMLTVPIWVELRIVSLTVLDALRNVFALVFVAVLVAAGGNLLSFWAVQIPVALLLIPLTLKIARSGAHLAAGIRLDVVRWLVRQTIPLAVALAMSVIYFRVLIVLVSLVSTDYQTGLFGTSFRIFEVIVAAPTLILPVALPLLSVAGGSDEERLRYGLQRMSELALLAAALVAILIGILALPGILLVGGAQYDGAAPVLRIHALALIPLSMTITWQLGLVAARAQRSLAVANGLGLAIVVALGLVLIPVDGARGAAWAAVAAESALATFLLIALRRARPNATPRLWFAWKIALAAGCAVAPALFLPQHPLLGAVAATIAYLAAALLTRAVPADVFHAFRMFRQRSG